MQLPGRTDNEIKNFWHSRLRRRRKQYLDIYPPNLGDEISLQGELNAGGRNHFNHDNYTCFSMDASSHVSRYPFDHSEQQNTNVCYTSHSPDSTSPNQTQFPANHVSFSSTQGISSSYQPQSPGLYTTEMHPLSINTTQYQFPSVIHSELLSNPPPINKFSSPDQGSIISAPSSSVSSHKLQGSSSASQISSPLNAITKGSPTRSAELHTSMKQPTASKLLISSLASPVSCNQTTPQLNISTTASAHSPLALKVMTPFSSHSCLQVNPSMIQSPRHSPLCSSSTLESPVTSQPLGSQSEMLLNCSSLLLTKECPLGFQLPQYQSSPCLSNITYSGTCVAVKSELPSIQYSENTPRQIQEVKINVHKMDIESSGIQGAKIQEAPPKIDLLSLSLKEGDRLDKCLINNNSGGKFNRSGKTRDNSFNQDTFSLEAKKKGVICEGRKTFKSSRSRVSRKNLQGNLRVDKCSKTETVRGKISRSEGLLTEISKTGILLVESAKKERLVSQLLNEGSNLDFLSSQSPKTENMQFDEVSMLKNFLDESFSIEDSWTDFSKEKDSRSEASNEDALLIVNSTLFETENLGETLSDKRSWESVLLASYEQEEMLDLAVLCTEADSTTQSKPDGIDYELDSVQVASASLQEHELKTFDPVQFDKTSMNQLESGDWVGDIINYVEASEDDSSKKSLMTEHPENLNEDFIEQIHPGDCWGKISNGEDILAVHNKQMVLDDESNWGVSHYSFSKMASPFNPNVASRCIGSPAGELLPEGQWMKDSSHSSNRNLKRRCSEDKSFGKRFLRERVNGLQELTVNDYIPLTAQSSNSFAQCCSSEFLKPIHALTSLLEHDTDAAFLIDLLLSLMSVLCSCVQLLVLFLYLRQSLICRFGSLKMFGFLPFRNGG